MARISPRHWFMILSIILGPQNFYRDRWGSFFNFFFVGVVLTSKMLPPTKGRSRNRRGGNSRRGNNTVGERSVILDGTGYLNSPNLLWLVPVSSSPPYFINRCQFATRKTNNYAIKAPNAILCRFCSRLIVGHQEMVSFTNISFMKTLFNCSIFLSMQKVSC